MRCMSCWVSPALGCSFTTNLQAVHSHRGWESASCAHTLNATSEGQDTYFRLKGGRPPSHLSPIPDMLIPAIVAGGHGWDRLEVSVSRCVHAVRPCQKTAIREGLERKQLLFGGIWKRGILKKLIWQRLLIHSCHLSVMIGCHSKPGCRDWYILCTLLNLFFQFGQSASPYQQNRCDLDKTYSIKKDVPLYKGPRMCLMMNIS